MTWLRLFPVTYAAPRFLTPGLRDFVAGRRADRGFLGHAAIQVRVVTTHLGLGTRRSSADILAMASTLRLHGTRRGCVVLGYPSWNQNLAHALRCTNAPDSTGALRRTLADGTQVVWLTKLDTEALRGELDPRDAE